MQVSFQAQDARGRLLHCCLYAHTPRLAPLPKNSTQCDAKVTGITLKCSTVSVQMRPNNIHSLQSTFQKARKEEVTWDPATQIRNQTYS